MRSCIKPVLRLPANKYIEDMSVLFVFECQLIKMAPNIA